MEETIAKHLNALDQISPTDVSMELASHQDIANAKSDFQDSIAPFRTSASKEHRRAKLVDLAIATKEELAMPSAKRIVDAIQDMLASFAKLFSAMVQVFLQDATVESAALLKIAPAIQDGAEPIVEHPSAILLA